MTYEEQLKDPRWQARRLEILNRDHSKCVTCRRGDLPLHVHHIKYTGMAWEAPDSDLVTLCHICHSGVHDKSPLATEYLKLATRCASGPALVEMYQKALEEQHARWQLILTSKECLVHLTEAVELAGTIDLKTCSLEEYIPLENARKQLREAIQKGLALA
jgi:hypothetical protein